MTMPIASLFGWAGLFGMVVARFLARFLGTSEHNLLLASSACLALAGLICWCISLSTTGSNSSEPLRDAAGADL